MSYSGVVLKSTGSWYEVEITKNGKSETVESRLPGRFRLEGKEVTNPVAVGDHVEISVNEDGTGTIEDIKSRRNYITRQATHGRRGEQILAANIDRAWVVQSIRKPKLKTGFVDRFLVSCEAYEVPAGIVFNKIDLAKSKAQKFIDHLEELYLNLGYRVLQTSIFQPDSLTTLQSALDDQTSVFVGPSGVGKTSLLNAIDPHLNLKTGKISEYSKKGKHTTTFAKIVSLSSGGRLVDTPGIREFGLVNISEHELYLYFPEMVEPAQNCKYYDCTHYHEPDCGVVEAFENGDIDPSRYESYLNMIDSIKE